MPPPLFLLWHGSPCASNTDPACRIMQTKPESKELPLPTPWQLGGAARLFHRIQPTFSFITGFAYSWLNMAIKKTPTDRPQGLLFESSGSRKKGTLWSAPGESWLKHTNKKRSSYCIQVIIFKLWYLPS